MLDTVEASSSFEQCSTANQSSSNLSLRWAVCLVRSAFSDGGSEEDTEVVDSLRCWKGSGKRLSAESSMLEGYRERT
jgi:hypothetical protein